jgi:hypothetical protein
VFFLHIGTGPDNTNNVLTRAIGVLIVTLVLSGSLWITANLQMGMMQTAAANGKVRYRTDGTSNPPQTSRRLCVRPSLRSDAKPGC